MLETLRLRNFKSFGDVNVPFGPFTLIYGSNGVGKSNLLDALRFLLAIGQGRSVRDAIEGHASAAGGPTATVMTGIRGGAQNLPRYGAGTTVFELEVTLTAEQAGRITYTVAVDTSAYKIVREELKASRHSGSYVFSTHPDVAPLKQTPDSPAISARYYTSSPGRNPSRSFSSHEFVINQFTGRKAETVANERWAEAVRRELAALTPLELHPEVLRQYSPLGRFTLGEHGENFAAVTWSLLARAAIEQTVDESPGRGSPNIVTAVRRDGLDWDDDSLDAVTRDARARLSAICSWLAELTPRQIEGLAVEWAPTNEVIFSLYEAPHERPLNARVLSDGTLRLAALAVALLGQDRRETFVIEEIENGVNPARVQLLLRLVDTATRSGGGKQVIATTHAPALLDALPDSLREYTLVIGWDEEDQTSVVTGLRDLPGLSEAEATASLGDLLTEGWVQMAADR